MKMGDLGCILCESIMVNKGKIPDGILFICKNCNSKRIIIDNLNQMKNAEVYGNAYLGKFDQRKVSSLLKLFNEHSPGLDSEKKILDVGCGYGEFMKALIDAGFNVSGIECDSAAANHLIADGINVCLGELGKKIEISTEYDIITLWDVLEHIENVEVAMGQLDSLARKNAKIFILTPDSESLFDFFAEGERRLTFNSSQRIMNICLNRYHLHRFSIKGLQLLLNRFGFIIDHVQRLQLFSLMNETYLNGFAPGIKSWTNNESINKLLSRTALTLIKTFNISNKIFLTAVKT